MEPGGLFTMEDFEEGVQTLDTAITDMSACMQSQLLAVEVRSRSKQFFLGAIVW